jgi:hypothetical protein
VIIEGGSGQFPSGVLQMMDTLTWSSLGRVMLLLRGALDELGLG